MLVHSTPEALLAALDAPCSAHARKGACVTIGNFDGVHAGHRALLRRVRRRARAAGLYCLVVTFWPHPLSVLRQNRSPGLIAGQDQKAELLRSQGMDAVLELPFTPALAAMPPEEFVRRLLLPLRLRHLVVGYDFCLGKGRAGNAQVLATLGQGMGFSLEQLPPVKNQGQIVSSTRIRQCLGEGAVQEILRLRGQPHCLRGRVHKSTGRIMGLTAASLDTGEVLLPRSGAYAAWAHCGGRMLPALTYVRAPEDGGESPVRTVLLDQRADMLGQDIVQLYFVQRLQEAEAQADAGWPGDMGRHIAAARTALAQGGHRPTAQPGGGALFA